MFESQACELDSCNMRSCPSPSACDWREGSPGVLGLKQAPPANTPYRTELSRNTRTYSLVPQTASNPRRSCKSGRRKESKSRYRTICGWKTGKRVCPAGCKDVACEIAVAEMAV